MAIGQRFRRKIALLAASAVAPMLAAPGPLDGTTATTFEVEIREPDASLNLDPFYRKMVDADGIPVLGSEKVADEALRRARAIVVHMLARRPDVRKALIRSKMRVSIMAESESTTDLPEQRDWKKPTLDDPRLTPGERADYDRRIGRMTDKEYWNWRARGMGGNPASGAEENLLNLPGDRYRGENIFVHEFSHALMNYGLARADRSTFVKIRVAYKEAMARGLWKGAYASNTVDEYWAEGTQFWFWSNDPYFDGGVRVESPADLRAYDPALYAILEQVYPDHQIPADPYHAYPGRR